MRAGATLRGVRLRLALALGLVVAATLAVVYLIVVPSLESELITAKLDQLEVDANTVARGSRDEVGNEQPYVEAAASVVQARVVFYSVLEDLLLIQGDSNLTSSTSSVTRRRCAPPRPASCSATPSSAAAGSWPRSRFRFRRPTP